MTVLRHGEGEAEQRILRGLRLAVELSVIVLVLEAVGAFLSRSLSVTVDAVHNIPDIAAFALSWSALRGTQTGATSEFTYGKHRVEVFAGMFNGVIVLVTGAAFGYTAIMALAHSALFAGTVDPTWVLVVAGPTLALRVVNLSTLGRLPRPVRDLNLRSVVLHLGSDVAITVALLVAGLTLLLRPQFAWADSSAAVAIAAILVYESFPLLRGGWEVLTERTPRGLSVEGIRTSVLSVPGVTEVHDVHVWAVCDSLVCLTAHVGVHEVSMREGMEITRQLRNRMEHDFGIVHSTFELEAT